MQLTRGAVNRPITTLMTCLCVILLGAVSLRQLSVDLMPDLTFPTVTVTTLYRGAGPEEIETLITRPMEQALSGVSGVERISSDSVEGSSSIRVEFSWGRDLDSAVSDLREAAQKVTPNFPEEVEDPYFRRYDIADSPIIYLGVKSELDPLELSELAENTIVPQLERIEGVARVRLRGHSIREIQVDLRRDKLEALNMGVNEVVAALQAGNVNQPAGDFEEGNLNLLIRARGEFRNLDQIAQTVIRQTPRGIVRVSDVATVSSGEEEKTELTRTNGEPGIMIYLYKQAGANTIDVSDRVASGVDAINAGLRGAQLMVRQDKSDFIRDAITNVKESAFYGMGLALIVLILFLQSFRSTLVIAISMPLSVLFTFVLIYFNGFTLNMVSFGGLALGIGMLVDNSIVVLESIFRYRDMGVEPKEAAIRGTNEVATAIIASTVTTLIVFVPLMFIEGTTGVLLHQLAAVVAYSLICSLAASLTLTPVLAAYWIKDIHDHEQIPAWRRAGRTVVEGFHSLTRRMCHALESGYAVLLNGTLRHPGKVGFVLVAIFSATLGLYPLIGTEFLPKTDEGSLMVTAEMAPGIQLDTLDRQAKKIERDIVDSVPESIMMASFIGDSADDGSDWNRSRFSIQVSKRSERERTIEDIRKGLSKEILDVAGMKTSVRADSSNGLSRMLRMSSSDGGNLAVEIRGHDRETARELAELVEAEMLAIPGLINVEYDRRDARPELFAEIDRDKAGSLGINVGDITQTLETTVRGTESSVFRQRGNEYNILVRLRPDDRNRVADLQQVGVATPAGSVVPLKSLVSFKKGESDVNIQRLDRQRVMSVSGEVEGRDLGSVVRDLQERLASLPVPADFTLSITGDWEEQQESFRSLLFGFILAVTMMYMVMASQFESLRDPLLILCSVPLGAIGVIAVLVGTNTTLNVQSYIGIVMLAGIVVNNAIVLIDYIKQLQQESPERPLTEIVFEAGRRRFRPILMTTLTTVLAMLPISLGWGEGGELQAPMARVVVGGLTSATLITLFAIPILAIAFMKRPQKA